jgi:hypothetical protein
MPARINAGLGQAGAAIPVVPASWRRQASAPGGYAMVDTRFEDGRVQRRDLTGVWTGAAAGALVAIVVAVLMPLAGTAAATAVGIALGACAGAWLGRSVVRQVSADDWEPFASHRSYVGARAPDAES